MPLSATSTFPRTLKVKDLTLADVHLCTGVPMPLLEGYEQGRFKPAAQEREVLTGFGHVLDSYPTPVSLALYLDKRRFQLLRTIMPHADIDHLLTFKNYEDYRSALHELCVTYHDKFEIALAAYIKKVNHYDPAGRE